MKQKILFIPLVICAFLFVFEKNAYAEKYPFRTYSVDDGLPHPSVSAIFQDSEGYMWFGTLGGGVSRFDGRTFTNYSTRNGLVINDVSSIFQDKEGNLWLLTYPGATKFDGEKWTDLEKEKGVSFPGFTCGLMDSKGRGWFGTWHSGIAMLEGDSLRFIDTKELGGGSWVISIIEDKNSNIWFATNGGALKYDGAEWTNYKTRGWSILEDSRGNIWFGDHGVVSKFDGTDWRVYSLPAGFERFDVGCMCEDREGNLWFGTHPQSGGTREKGVLKFDGANWSNYTTENGLGHDQITSLFTDREGNVWLGTDGRGVCKFSGAGFTTFTTEDGLASNKIEGASSSQGIFEDSRGNLWCLSNSGISKFDGKNWFTYNTENVLKRNWISSICEDRKGNIWFGAYHWVVKFDGRRFTHYSEEETGLRDEIISILEDDKGNLWFGSSHHGVSRFDGKNWTNFLEQGKIPGFRTQSSFKDSKGNLWFGHYCRYWDDGVTRYDGKNWITYMQEGLGIYDGDKGIIFYSQDSIVRYKYDQDNWIPIASEPRGAVDAWIENYLTGDKVGWFKGILYFGKYFEEDSQGNIWFATDVGVNKYDGENWTRYTTEDGLADNKVNCIFEDSEGNLWFGTKENGISRFDGHGFTSYTTEDGLSSDNCYYIFQDGDYIYIGTAAGLSRFDGERFKAITVRDGLASSELTNSYLADSKGNLWFGTANGLTKYNPALDRPNVVPPPVYITKVSMFGKDITGEGYSRFSYKENNLRFDYIGICLTSPEDVSYRYKLEGLDSDWIETEEAFASYPYLPPGEYAFKVKACNNDGLWNEGPAAISFVILPPFWGTLWFKGLILVFALGIILAVYEIKTRSMKKRNIELSREISERKLAEEKLISYQNRLRSMASELSLAEEKQRRQIAVDLHDQIGQTLTISKIKIQQLRDSKSSADSVTARDDIVKLIEQAIQDTRSLTFELSPPLLYELGLEQALEWLVEHIHEKHGILARFDDDKQAKPLDNDIRVLLFQAVRELLFNVAKHSKVQNAVVSIRRNGDRIRVQVEDQGVGFDSAGLHSNPDLTGGFGLFSIGERLNHLGGSMEIQSRPGHGTRITLVAPLKRNLKTGKKKPNGNQNSSGR